MKQCYAEGCDKKAIANGLCDKHYRRLKHTGKLETKRDVSLYRGRKTNEFCDFPGCKNKIVTAGLCSNHYKQKLKYGKPGSTLGSNKKSLCGVDGCDVVVHSRGLCSKHYRRLIAQEDSSCLEFSRQNLSREFYLEYYRQPKYKTMLQDPVSINGGKCRVDGCEKVAKECGMCLMHYARLRNHGDVNTVLRLQKYPTEKERADAVRQNSRLHDYRKRSRSGSKSERWTKAQVVEKSNGICALCGEPIDMTLKNPHRSSFSVDHIIPLSKGGSNLFDNVQAAHLSCNSSKNNRVR